MIEDEQRPAPTAHKPEPVAKAVDGPSMTEGRETTTPRPAAMSGADFQTYIGRGLRAVYDDVAQQPIPDRFLDLMKKLG